jgi:hypothetical protein
MQGTVHGAQGLFTGGWRCGARESMHTWYSESGHATVVSSFGGMPFSTSSLVRRSMKGRSSREAAASCSWSICATLALSSKAVSKAADEVKTSG